VQDPISFRIDVTESKAAAVVALHGELVLETVDEADAVLASAAERKQMVTIDLRGLSFMDSGGVALLVRYDAMARQDSFNLFVVRGKGEVQQLLDLCRLGEHLEMIDAPEDLAP
jgi:anti-sigma B factor antagonist